MCVRSEIPEGMENVDMSLEDLQLLLRSHQQSMETSAAAMDVSLNRYSERANPMFTHVQLNGR